MEQKIHLNYKEHFSSNRPDGRNYSVIAAQMAIARDKRAELSLPEELDKNSFDEWKQNLKKRLVCQLNMPDLVEKPEVVNLQRLKRDGYTVEKWELYPDKFTSVPFLVLIPDIASKDTRVPGVICFPDIGQTKEFTAGEMPLGEHPNYNTSINPETDQMALYLVQNGFAVFVFDNPGDGECSVLSDAGAGVTQDYLREILCHGLLEMGLSFTSVSVFQKLHFIDCLDSFAYVDKDKIGLCAQGLGADAAIIVGLLSEKIKCIVFNNILKDDRYLFGATTEHNETKMENEIEKWHIIPGKMKAYGYQDLCAAFAPRALALTEGGADEFVNTVKRSYEFCGVPENLSVCYYEKFADCEKRTLGVLPETGMSRKEFERYSYVDGVKRIFRKEPAIKFFKKQFEM